MDKRMISYTLLVTAVVGLASYEYVKANKPVEIKEIVAEEYYDSIIELDTNEEIEEFMVKLSDDWKEYLEMKYVPDISNDMVQITDENYEKNTLYINEENYNLDDIIKYVNPYNVSYSTVTTKSWNMNYGKSQINLKLLPLAKYFYEDFEYNEKSQVQFLQEYLKIKQSKGKNIDQALYSWLNGEDM